MYHSRGGSTKIYMHLSPVLNNKQGSNEGGRRQKYLFDIDYPKLAAATPVSEQSSSLATKIKFVK